MIDDVKNHFRTELGLPDDMLADFVETFLVSLDACVADLQAIQAAPEMDFMAVRRVTHTLRGLAETSGATDLVKRSLALNASAHAADAESCRCGVQDILGLCAQYRAG